MKIYNIAQNFISSFFALQSYSSIIDDLFIVPLGTPDGTQAETIGIIVTVIVVILIGSIIVIGVLLSIRYLIIFFSNVSIDINVLGVDEKTFLTTM